MSMNTYDGPYPAGVPNPFGVRVHAYPTRYHGPVYTRPMHSLDWMDRPYDFGVSSGTAGLGDVWQNGAPPSMEGDPAAPGGCAVLGPNFKGYVYDPVQGKCVPPAEPRNAADCNAAFPVPVSVESAEDFAAYMQNEACQERVKQAKDGRRWLIGLSVVFVAGFWLGRKA